MQFGIIGTGVIAAFHAKAIAAMDHANLGGVADKKADRATQFAADNNTKAYESVEAMLADPSIELITICTPSGAHYEPAMMAMEAGKHVVVEKPLEVTVKKIDEMMAKAVEKNVLLSAVLNRRFHPAMEFFKGAVDTGRFGTLTSASAYVKWFRTQAYYDSAGWRGTWALDGGGAIMNQSIHTIDALLHLAGPVKSIQANTECLAHDHIEVEDSAVAILEFVNGARGVIEGSTASWSKDGHPARVQLCGSEGSVFMADEDFEVWEFAKEAPEDATIHENHMRGNAKALGAADPTAIDFKQHQRNFEEVLAAIDENRQPSTSAHEARKSVVLIEALYESARNDGQKIHLS